MYADGLRNGIPTAHSLVLCFMMGPLGLLSHLVTKAVVEGVRNRGGGGGDAKDNTVMYRF